MLRKMGWGCKKNKAGETKKRTKNLNDEYRDKWQGQMAGTNSRDEKAGAKKIRNCR
jgi:hypothetical protein